MWWPITIKDSMLIYGNGKWQIIEFKSPSKNE